jgi:hypothetical protein
MKEISPEKRSEQSNGARGPLVLDIRRRIDVAQVYIPKPIQNFDRAKRTNVGLESMPADELAELELGPNNCAAE